MISIILIYKLAYCTSVSLKIYVILVLEGRHTVEISQNSNIHFFGFYEYHASNNNRVENGFLLRIHFSMIVYFALRLNPRGSLSQPLRLCSVGYFCRKIRFFNKNRSCARAFWTNLVFNHLSYALNYYLSGLVRVLLHPRVKSP